VAGVLASVATFALVGLDSSEVTVEVDVRRGLPVFTVVAIRAMMRTRDNNAATSAARPGLQVEKKTVPRRPSRNVIDPSVAQR